jgi:hypothetical protein
MPHSPEPDTTPPQARKPGATDGLLARLEAPTAFGGTTSEDAWETYDPLHLDTADEIRRLRTR